MLQHFAKILQESQPQHRLGRHGTSYKSHKDGKPTKSQATSHGSNNNPSKSHHQPNEPQGQGTDGESYKESHNRLSLQAWRTHHKSQGEPARATNHGRTSNTPLRAIRAPEESQPTNHGRTQGKHLQTLKQG